VVALAAAARVALVVVARCYSTGEDGRGGFCLLWRPRYHTADFGLKVERFFVVMGVGVVLL
jgi:hypothetical protein